MTDHRIIALVLAFVVLGAGVARAADDGPTDPCMQQAYDLAQAAEAKQLTDATLEKLDGMFNVMEKHCKALEGDKAKAQAAEIKALIDAGK